MPRDAPVTRALVPAREKRSRTGIGDGRTDGARRGRGGGGLICGPRRGACGGRRGDRDRRCVPGLAIWPIWGTPGGGGPVP